MNKKNFKEEKQYQDQVEGRNAVIELLESGRDINKIFVSNGEKNGSINKILAMAKEKRVIVTEVNRKKLEEMQKNLEEYMNNRNDISNIIKIQESQLIQMTQEQEEPSLK